MNDYFLKLNEQDKEKAFSRHFNGYNDAIQKFLQDYYRKAQSKGIIVNNNFPVVGNGMSWYTDVLGIEFRLDNESIVTQLIKFLSGVRLEQAKKIGNAVYDTLVHLQQKGKTQTILKNVYVKFMCWLRYWYTPIVKHLCTDSTLKVLYIGNISRHELLFLNALYLVGSDIVFVQREGDDSYLGFGPQSEYSIE